jgi:hypothetical protein
MFNAPIPGMSLTGEPKKYPWERPPEYSKPDDVANYYLDRLTDEKVMKATLDYLEVGDLTLRELVEGITRIGVSKGLHTIDAGLLVAPLLHKTIKVVADGAGVDYDEGLTDKKNEEEIERVRKRLMTKKMLAKFEPTKEEAESFEEASEEAPEELEEEPKPQGLIARRK